MTFEDQEMAGSTTAMTQVKQKEKLLNSTGSPMKSDEVVNAPIDF
jgi:hypothetical protein